MKKFFKHVLGGLFFLTLISISFIAGYFIVLHVFRHFHLEESDFIRYITALIIGFLIMVGLGFLVSIVTRSRHMHIFQEVVAALRKIARGDFNVHLEIKIDREHPWSKIVENINHMAEKLQEMESLRQEFISNVSHEIQSPLTSISGFARALHNDQLSSSERSHYLSIIETESKRLSKLSDNLLKLTSLESEHQPFEKKLFRLDQQLRNIILACEVQWVEKKLAMDVDLEHVTVLADGELLSQVWINLIHNSIKFTPPLGTIRVTLQKKDDYTVVNISDTGIGISIEDQVHIFERFYKADKARQRSAGGSGLGLSIAKKIVEMHEGTISVESRMGEGTMFTVALPLVKEK